MDSRRLLVSCIFAVFHSEWKDTGSFLALFWHKASKRTGRFETVCQVGSLVFSLRTVIAGECAKNVPEG